MFGLPTLRLGRIFGIPVEVNASWLFIFGVVTASLGTSYFPAVASGAGPVHELTIWLVAATTSILFFASVLGHELAHAIVTRLEGGSVDRITLFMFGGVAQIDEEPRSAGREFLMAAAGPGTSLLIAAGMYAISVVARVATAPWWLTAPAEYLAVINMALGIFNLLPGFPLDGGRVLRSILWAVTGDAGKATRWSARSGQLIGWGMVSAAVIGVLGGRTDLLWTGLIGWFIASLAGQAYQQQVVRSRFEGVSAGDIMTATPVYVDGSISLEELVTTHVLGSRHTRFPVMHDGAIVGLVTLPAVKAVPRHDWPYVSTLEVTDRDLDALTVDVGSPAESALSKLAPDRPGALLVVGDHRLVGILTRADVMAAFERQSEV